MLRTAGARLCEIASRIAQHGHLKTRMSRSARVKEKAKVIATRMGDGDRPRSGLRDRASPEGAKTRYAALSPLAIAWGARTAGARPCPIRKVVAAHESAKSRTSTLRSCP